MNLTPYQLPVIYKRLVNNNKPNYILEGGRVGGKTTGTAICSTTYMLANPYRDVVFARVSYGSLADSSYAEVEKELESLPESIRSQFTLKKSPLRIVRKNNSGTIYFIGYGGSNTSRTKSIVTSHPIGMVCLEETQELKDRENLEQIKASLQRHFDVGNAKFVVLGNPPATKAHWFNQFIEEKKRDVDWEVIKITYLDILPFINDLDLKDILKAKVTRPDFYEWFYIGNPTGALGSIYPMFNAKQHIITAREFSYFLENTPVKIAGVVIGGDGAVTHDETVFTPIFILTNGQSVVGPCFIHDPTKDAIVGSHRLVQDHVKRWFNQLLEAYHLGGTEAEIKRNPYARKVPIWFRIDSAATDLIQECKFFFSWRADVAKFTKSSIVEMVGVMQSAICDNRIYLVDYGGYYDYYQNKWIQTEMHPIAEQLEMLKWNEKETGYDPDIPNDRTDALTYGTNFWFANTENMQWFNILKINNIQNTLIRDIIKIKEE